MNCCSPRLLPGDLVEVRTPEEIKATLDPRGCFEGLPFMAEMARFCGQRFRVFQRPERTCIELGGFGQLPNAVMLGDLRCDGSLHDGCQRGCTLLWKESWLRKVKETDPSPSSTNGLSASLHDFPTPLVIDGRYVCQVTEQTNSTRLLRGIEFGQYVRDWRARNISPFRFFHYMSIAAFVRFRQLFTDIPFAGLQGRLKKTPSEVLNLHEGELVRVKSAVEIEATLDTLNRNRGLIFTAEMRPFCGKTYRVLRPVNRIIDPFGKMLEMKNTVILENATCDGRIARWGGCSRFHYHFWREVWLERVPSASPPTPTTELMAKPVKENQL